MNTLKHKLHDVVVIISKTDGIYGETGVIEKVDATDPYLPYRVRMDKNGDVYWYTADEVNAVIPGIVRTWGDAQAEFISEDEFVRTYMDEADECDVDVEETETESDTYLVVSRDSDEDPIGFWTYLEAYEAAQEMAIESEKSYGVFKMVAEVEPVPATSRTRFFS